MRDVVQEILHDITGQFVYIDCPEGRPSSVTSATVHENLNDDDGPTESALGAPAVETNPDATLAAAAGPSQADPNAVTLNVATGIATDRPFLLASVAGDSEWVEFAAFNAATAAGGLRAPLINNYAITTSTLKSTRIKATVDATWVASKDNLSTEDGTEPRYRVEWIYVAGGVTYRRATMFDLVRYSGVHNVLPYDVDARFPGWLDALPLDYRREQGRGLIAQAFRSLKIDLRADGKLARWIRNQDVVSELVIIRANLLAVELRALRAGTGGELGALQSARDIYRQRYEQLIREPHTGAAAGPMGGQREARKAPLWRK